MNDMHLVMHGLAIKKHATAEDVAGVLGLDAETVRQTLAKLVAAKRAVEAQGVICSVPAARMLLDADYSRHYEALRADPAFQAGYAGFERLNGTLKQLITDWQTLPVRGERAPNDHSDKAYDAEIIDRLGDLHERAEAVLAKLASALPRMSLYRDKLEAALERAEKGEIAWVSDAKIDSYHTVWFELHEDLLRLMQRERSEIAMALAFGQWTLALDGEAAPPRELIGGKAWSVARMQALGLRVPPAFVVTTAACRAYLASGAPPEELEAEIDKGVAWLEAQTGRRLWPRAAAAAGVGAFGRGGVDARHDGHGAEPRHQR